MIVLTILIYTVISLLLLLFFGSLYEKTIRFILERNTFPYQKYVLIEGKKIHYVKKGEGACTVVFVSGMGSGHYIWKTVQDKLAVHAVTISYDRDGLLFSDYNKPDIDNEGVSNELEILLQKTGCPEKYILVAHSMAGIYIRPFVEKHKKDIQGIVLVESAHPLQIKMYSPALFKKLQPPPYWMVRILVSTGVYRLLFSFLPLSPEIPIRHPLHKMEKNFFYRSCRRVYDELRNDARNMADAETYNGWGNIPLSVIRGTSDIRYASFKKQELSLEYQSLWNHLQSDLLHLSTRSSMTDAPNSGHLVPLGNPEVIVASVMVFLQQV